MPFFRFVFYRLGWVILFITCISIVSAYWFSINVGISFALGATISLIPIFIFGKFFLKNTSLLSAARKILNAFYIGEIVKIITTIILFVIVLQWQGLTPLSLFLGFITAQLGFLLVAAGIFNRKKG